MFKESFLHFIWQYQYFNSESLKDTNGNALEIVRLGTHNNHEGPDFKDAHIRIDGLEWYGNIEIHKKASDWYRHGHETDDNYDNVVLHVVWEYDQDIHRKDQTVIPTLELKGKIKPGIIKRYKEIIASKTEIPCERVFSKVRPITKLSMLERTLIQRLQLKSDALLTLLEKNNRNWEITAYQWLGIGFGFKTNAKSFLELTRKAPLKSIQKHSNDQSQIEAILFGQSGFLIKEYRERYPKELFKEHLFLKSKYDLASSMFRAQWTFGSVRPANYPLRRISQFASLLTLFPNIFSFFIEANNDAKFEALTKVKSASYWAEHIDFEKPSKKVKGNLSKSAIENLMINVTVPFLVALWRDREDEDYLQSAQNLLMRLSAEKNHILDSWQSIGWNVSNAYDSQGLIHLYNNYCMKKRCLECAIGLELIKN